MMKNLCTILLVVVLCIGSVFRLYNVSSVPPALSLDEVSTGFNAYSILKTGKDEFGNFFPILMRAYDDYRPALYMYIVVPFVFLFGLTAVAVRLPSVLLSIVSLGVMYLFIRDLLALDRVDKKRIQWMSFLSVLLLAISPWHIYISRLGHEANLGACMYIVLLWTLLRAVSRKNDSVSLVASSVVASLSLNSYQSMKVIVPLTVIVFGFLYWRRFLAYGRGLLFTSLIIGISIAFPISAASVTSEGLLRLKGTSALVDNPYMTSELTRYVEAKRDQNIIGTFVHHRFVAAAIVIGGNYFSHFQPEWLFRGGAFESHKIPYTGIVFFWQTLFIGVSLIYMLRHVFCYKHTVFVLTTILLISPIPASVTTQAPHVMRSLTSVFGYAALSGIGAVVLFKMIPGALLRGILLMVLVFFVVFSSWQMATNYYVVFPKTQSQSFQYALTRALSDPTVEEQISPLGDNYRLVVSNTDNLYQSYMFYLFYSAYSPTRYIENGGTAHGGFRESHTIGHIYFGPIRERTIGGNMSTYGLVNPGEDIGVHYSILKEYRYLDGTPGVWFVKLN